MRRTGGTAGTFWNWGRVRYWCARRREPVGSIRSGCRTGRWNHATVPGHHDGRLGKWYETGQGAQSFGSVPSFASLVQPHAKVHEKIQEAISYLGQSWENDRKLQSNILNAFQQAEQASDEVLVLMDRIVAEKHAS